MASVCWRSALTPAVGLGFEVGRFGLAFAFGLRDRLVNGLPSLLLGFRLSVRAALARLFGGLDRVGVRLLDDLLRLRFGLLDFLNQFHVPVHPYFSQRR